MNKLDKFQAKQVKLNFITKESWLKVRNKDNDSICENCRKPHSECNGDIALITFNGRLNAHVCEACGRYFINKGAVDINIMIDKNKAYKDKLIKQAKRIGIRFENWYSKKKAEDYQVSELREKISKHIKSERNKFHEFLKYPHLTILKEFVDALNEDGSKYTTTYFDAFKEVPDALYDYDTDNNYRHHRWCSYFDATIKIGDKTFSYNWANANGDNSLEDAGFDPNNVWESMRVIDDKEDILVLDKLNQSIELLKKALIDLNSIPNKKYCNNYDTCVKIEKFLKEVNND